MPAGGTCDQRVRVRASLRFALRGAARVVSEVLRGLTRRAAGSLRDRTPSRQASFGERAEVCKLPEGRACVRRDGRRGRGPRLMFGRAVDRYIVAAVLPYLALSLAILSIIILIQQTSKFADVLGTSAVPLRLTLEVTLNVLPNILIFTLPMSTLVGVATGYS